MNVQQNLMNLKIYNRSKSPVKMYRMSNVAFRKVSGSIMALENYHKSKTAFRNVCKNNYNKNHITGSSKCVAVANY